MLRPHVATFLDVASAFRKSSDLDLEIEQMEIGPSSPVVSFTLEQLRLGSKYGVIVLAIQRKNGSMQFNPSADLRIESGDVLITMGERPKLKRLELEIGKVGAQS
jgi:voltage-gated potassium channel